MDSRLHINLAALVVTSAAAVCLGLVVLPDAAAAALPPITDPADTTAAQPDTTLLQNHGWLYVMPVLAYTPETRFIGGISAGRYYRLDKHPDSRPSTTTPTVLYTANQQTIIWLPVDIYWQRDTMHAMGGLNYANYPDKFFGIGNDTSADQEEDYTPRTFSFDATVQRMILPDLYLGGSYEVASGKLIEVEPGGLLETGLIPGSEGGTISGLGVVADLDSRDDIFFPAAGTYLTAAATVYGSALGSDFDYTRYDLNLRQYLGLFSRNVLALQGWITTTNGSPPFQAMPRLSLRGYFEGRFRDLNQILFQAEYRSMLWRRFGLALFTGAGQVAPAVRAFSSADFWTAYGFGLRFQVGGQERINIRIDFGFGENDSGTYLMIGEAF